MGSRPSSGPGRGPDRKARADCIVLGAGAAGLMCALTAGRRGRKVLVLDRSNKIGKKILMSGGGKCNFTNLHISPDRFLSENPHFCKSALSRFTQWDFIEMVEAANIEYFEKHTVNGLSGQLFCRDSSRQIVNLLRDACEQAGVVIQTGCETHAVEESNGFHLDTSLGAFHADSLVVATGALSIPSLGGSGFGYDLAKQFDLRLLPTRAGLVPLTLSGPARDLSTRLSGVALEVSCATANAEFREDMLFTHRGLSGPAILQISSYWESGEGLSINLMPGDDLPERLLEWKSTHPKARLRSLLSQRLPRKLVLELEGPLWSSAADQPLGEWKNQALQSVAEQLQEWPIKPSGTEGYRTAEVTLGGVATDQLSSRTMESTTSGLFFIGEVMDVTGHLGGFNFQWAWSSGHAAGVSV